MFRSPGLEPAASLPSTILYHRQLPSSRTINVGGPRGGTNSSGHLTRVWRAGGPPSTSNGRRQEGLVPPERCQWCPVFRDLEKGEARLRWPEPQVMLRGASVGVRKCGCHPADLLLRPQLPQREGTPLSASLALSPPHPPRQGPGTRLCPWGLLRQQSQPSCLLWLDFLPSTLD